MATIKYPIQIEREEHDEFLLAKRTALASAATIYAVVNTSAQGQASVVLDTGLNWVGFATITSTNPGTLTGNVTLNPGPNWIGFATITSTNPGAQGMTTLFPGPNFIGLVSIAQPISTTFAGNVTLDDGSLTGLVAGANYIGLATVDIGSQNGVAVKGNVTLSNPNTYIGLTTATLGLGDRYIGLVTNTQVGLVTTVNVGLTTLAPSPNYIGLVSIAQPISTTFAGNVTLDPGSKTAIVGNVTINPSVNWVGFATVAIGSGGAGFETVFQGGAPWSHNIIGNVTLSDAKTFIGLTTSTLGSSPAYIGLVTVANTVSVTFSGNVTLDDGSLTGLIAGANYIGLATVDIGSQNGVAIKGNVTLSDSKGFIGLVSVAQPLTFAGNVTLDAGSKTAIVGNVTINPSVNWIGFATIANALAWPDPKTYLGLVTVGGIGTVTLADPKGFIGLVTCIPVPISTYTAVSNVFSATGNSTLFVPPASQRWICKDLMVSSLGRSEVKVIDGTTDIIPYFSLSTTGGYISNFGDGGLRSGAINRSMVFALNGAATISVLANVRFET